MEFIPFTLRNLSKCGGAQKQCFVLIFVFLVSLKNAKEATDSL
jgi:hypothetical protein